MADTALDPLSLDEAELSPTAQVYDQTLFAEDVLFTNFESQTEESVPVQQNPRKKYLLLIVLGFFACAVLAGSMYLQMSRQTPKSGLFAEETSGPEAPQGIPALERQLSLLANDIGAADPLESPLAFPPIDFRLNLQDATVMQIQQQSR